jgi:hypothetical protein
MTTKPPRWLVRNVQAIAGPPVDVNGALAAAHDTDTEREGFIPARLSGAQVLSTVTDALAAAHDTDTEREGFIPARLSDTALRAALVSPLPTVGSFTYNPDGTVASDPDGNTYTWNTDGTPKTQTKGGVTRTYTWNTDGTLASVS